MTDSKADMSAEGLVADANRHLEFNRPGDALKSFDAAIAIKPGNPEAYYGRGNALRTIGRHTEALLSYDQAIGLKPDHAKAHNGRGLVLAALNLFSEAAKSYDKAIEIEPDNAEAYKYGGDLCSRHRRFESAVTFYDRAIALKPDYANAFYMRADALRNLKRYNEAHASIDKAISLDPHPHEKVKRLLFLQTTDRLIELDYPVVPAVRWDGVPHPQLAGIIAANNSRYAAHFEVFMRYASYLRAIPRNAPNGTAPYWVNPWLHPIDAISVYGLVASRNPRRYVEIGSGMSTKFARQAITDHQLRTEIISIDPTPRSEIDVICNHVIRAPLEGVDLAIFDRLNGDDIVFCDNSHRSFQNSDVTVFFLDVLPRLWGGPLIGVHDIFLPYDYPSKWVRRFYNEQYLLACWLLAGDHLRIELPIFHAASTLDLKQVLFPVLSDPTFAGTGDINCGFWFTLLR